MIKGLRFLAALALLFSVILRAGILDAAAPQFKPEKSQIKIGLPAESANMVAWYLAVDNGLYEQEGLKVEVVTFRGGSGLMMGVISKSIDVGIADLPALVPALNEGQKLKIFYAGVLYPGWTWYAVPRIKSFADVKGAKFGITTKGSTTDMMTQYALKSAGIDPQKDIQIVPVGASAERLAAMDKGIIDVAICAAPFDFIAKEKGFNLILRLSDIIDELHEKSHFATEEYIKNNPNTIKAVLRAYVQSVRLAKKNRVLAIKSIVKHVKLTEKHAGLFYDDFIDQIHEDGRLPAVKSQDKLWDMLIMAGLVKNKWPAERYFDSSLVKTSADWKP